MLEEDRKKNGIFSLFCCHWPIAKKKSRKRKSWQRYSPSDSGSEFPITNGLLEFHSSTPSLDENEVILFDSEVEYNPDKSRAVTNLRTSISNDSSISYQSVESQNSNQRTNKKKVHSKQHSMHRRNSRPAFREIEDDEFQVDYCSQNRYQRFEQRSPCYHKSISLESPTTDSAKTTRVYNEYNPNIDCVMVDRMSSDSAMISVFKAMKCIDGMSPTRDSNHLYTPLEIKRPNYTREQPIFSQYPSKGYSAIGQNHHIDY